MQWVEYDKTIVLTLDEGESIEIPKTTPIKLVMNYTHTHDGFVAGHNIPVKTGWSEREALAPRSNETGVTGNDWQRDDATVESQVTLDDRHSAEAL